MQQRTRVVAGAWAVSGLLLGASAAAQSPQIRVRTVVPAQIVRDVVHEIRPAVRAVVAGAAGEQRGDLRAEQIDRQTQRIALGASGLLELRNLVGDISVTAGGGREVTLEIVRRARGRTEADAKLGLERVRVQVEHRGERAVVRAEYPNEPRQRPQQYSVSVSYNVTAPAGTRVAVTSVSGDITVQGVKGDVSAQVTSGDITITGGGQVTAARTISGDVTLRDCTTEAGVTAGAMSGDVLLERVRASRIGIDVTGGDIVARDVSAESVQLKTLSGDVEFSGTLARGGRYELQSHSGDVGLTIAGGTGFELQANTFSGSISMPAGGIDLRNVSSSRRSLRGTAGDGAATVVVTTFSGDVRIARK